MTAAHDPRPPGQRDEDAPATVGELRTLRRWLAVAGVWAVAATAVGLIALLEEEDGSAPDAATGGDLQRVERGLERRIQTLEQDLRDAGTSEDVQRLEDRLEQAEQDASEAAADSRRARNSLTELDQRVGELEDRVDALAAQSDGGPDPGTGEGQ